MAASRAFTIDRALTDANLLGAALGPVEPWSTWLAVLRAAFALPLSDEECTVFASVAGDRAPPSKRVRELWAIIGRRGGKSRMAAALAVYQASFIKHDLAPGETGHVLVLAASRDQARVVFEYIRGFFRSSKILKQEIASITASEIRLHNGVIVSTHANSFRSIRGRTLLAAIFDEVALWRDEVSAVPDLEVYRAVLPALLTTRGMLIGISTPYRRTGLLYQKHRDHFGENGDDVLAVQGPSTTFNPNLSQSEIDAAIADDPEGARAEWEASFRADIAAFLDEATIEAAIDYGRPLELPFNGGHRGKFPKSYSAFVDPSGGRHDAFTICVGHQEGKSFICDAIRARKPPFDPGQVVEEFAALLKSYSVSEVRGDAYAGEWVAAEFAKHGIAYRPAEKNKSALYVETLPLFSRAQISIPDYPPLLRELRLLERKTHRGGRDSVDHPPRGSDDLANAVCGCAWHVVGDDSGFDTSLDWVNGPDRDPRDEAREFRRAQLWAHVMRHTGGRAW